MRKLDVDVLNKLISLKVASLLESSRTEEEKALLVEGITAAVKIVHSSTFDKSIDEDSLEARARRFAALCHGEVNQLRKYTEDPYIRHPEGVAGILRTTKGCDESLLAAAWLHDVVEDTDATLGEVRSEFGDEVANLVKMVTDFTPKDGRSRKERKQIYNLHLAKASPKGKTLKIADIIHNLSSIMEFDSDFGMLYSREKLEQLQFLSDGDADLYFVAKALVEKNLGG